MPDILIRGVPMPVPDFHTTVTIMGNGDVLWFNEKVGTAIPLPEGHGRGIDAERFRVILCRLMERQDDDSATHALRWAIECLDKLESLVDAERVDE